MNSTTSALITTKGKRVSLSDVAVSAVMHDLLAEVTVSQSYRNREKVNIEAVYTFPLPLDAVLLDLQVEIGGRVLKGVVVEKKAAEGKYEDAVAAGDAAVMLEVIEPGLYTMNVGNLLPEEKATITFSYSILYLWVGDRLRFFLPTTIAPRFGESPHRPHQVPQFSLMVENQFSLKVEIFGSLREAQFICPSHQVTLTNHKDRVVITLQQEHAIMDRDFILNVKAPQAMRSFTLCGPDGDGMAAVASFQPFFPGLQHPRPLNLAIVIDCSGSMEGDSMEQAKQALGGILDALQPHDHMTLIAFGDTTNMLSAQLLPCNKIHLGKARRFAKGLKANMGGTAIAEALHDTYAAMSATESADVFLVTDGEVSSWKTVVQKAKDSGHRIFTVGVGSAVSESFVRELASATGGECELVSPREGMADKVIRHFERMRAPRAKRVAIHWPAGARDVTPSRLGAVFEGDTIITCAHFDNPSISGTVDLEVETEKGEVTHIELPIQMAPFSDSTDRFSTVARLGASARLKELDESRGLETALRYRLVSLWTNWLVIAERPEGEKAQDLPVLRKVPQTLAAGWGGTGTVYACMSMQNLKVSKTAAVLPAPFRRLLALIEDEPSRLDVRNAQSLLREAGLQPDFDNLFRRADALGLNIDLIAAIVLARLLASPLGEHLSSRTQSAVASLQNYARQMTDTLRGMDRHGHALIRVTGSDISREVFRSEQVHAINESLERIIGARALLEHLQVCTRKLVERELRINKLILESVDD
jgi:Ca-activated chloride channel family protein